MKKVMLLFTMLCLIEHRIVFETREVALQVYINTVSKVPEYIIRRMAVGDLIAVVERLYSRR